MLFRNVARSSIPVLLVGAGKFASSYRPSRATSIGCRTRDANTVAVYESGPIERLTSSDALRPRSATSGLEIVRRARPAASVSSVSGVGAKKPWPAERRLVNPLQRTSAERRGLKNVPYWL